MANMKRRKRRRRRSKTGWRRTIGIVAALLLAAVAFVIDRHGGRYGIPTWSEIYTTLGISTDGPDAQLLADTQTTVTVLDVGQGDSVLIGQDGAYCLIDTGTSDSQDALVRSLRQAGVTDLQYLILTHPHADHTGGAMAVLENLQEKAKSLPKLGRLLGEGMSARQYIESELSEFHPHHIGHTPIGFSCPCTRESFSSYLSSLPESERCEILKGEFPLELECLNCGTKYSYTKEEFEKIYKEPR